MRRNIRLMLAAMIGPELSYNKQVYPITREDLPLDMQNLEGLVLDAIAYLDSKTIEPSKTNLIDYLGVRRNLPNPEQEINRLIDEKGDQQVSIRTMSVLYHAWASEQRLNVAALKVSEIAQNPMLDYQEKWDASYDLLMAQAPTDSFDEEDIGEERFMWRVAEDNRRAVEALKSNLDIGPELPFPAQKAFYSFHDDGEATMILGREGRGKTTVGQTIAEHIAWTQRLNCDVVYYALETPLSVLARRQFCRHNLIPYDAVKSGRIDLSSGKWKKVFETWMMSGRRKSDSSGMIRHFYSPDASVDALCTSMLRAAEASKSLGRRVVFFIDHLHSINWQATHAREGEFGALRSIARTLCAANNRANLRAPTHLFLLAQESNDDPGQMFGGKFASKRVQYVYSIEREAFSADDPQNPTVAGYDNPITVTAAKYRSYIEAAQKKGPAEVENIKSMYVQDKNTTDRYFALDALGNQRYWFRKGDEYKENMALHLVKANDGRLGRIRLRFEAAQGRISQDPEQMIELRKQGVLPHAKKHETLSEFD
jgi:hypothetical protein